MQILNKTKIKLWSWVTIKKSEHAGRVTFLGNGIMPYPQWTPHTDLVWMYKKFILCPEHHTHVLCTFNLDRFCSRTEDADTQILNSWIEYFNPFHTTGFFLSPAIHLVSFYAPQFTWFLSISHNLPGFFLSPAIHLVSFYPQLTRSEKYWTDF